MMLTNCSKHLVNDHLERTAEILLSVGLGNEIYRRRYVDAHGRDAIRALTDTGIMICYATDKKDFVITWAMPEPYVWDDDSTITARELTEALAAREITLAEIKKRNDEYKASQGKTPANTAPAPGVFNF